MKKKSLAINTILYTMKIASSMVFPLITFPYISRVLSASGIGKYNFSNSLVSYFLLIAGLGISTYAIREGAKIRENKEKFQEFAQEIFSINFLTTIVAVIALFFCLKVFSNLKPYNITIMILAISIPLTLIGTEWIFNVYEDFVYITVRSIFFQIISIILMFSWVKNESDVWKYAIISVFATGGANILNYTKVKKYFKHKICFEKNILKHLKPIFILFMSAVASQVYINADITMLGVMKGDYDTGIYSAASKIYNIARALLATAITIILPRLSFLCRKSKADYEETLGKIFDFYTCMIIPIAVGLLCLAPNAIILLSGLEFISATMSLKILCVAMIFSTLGSFIANAVLIIYNKEKLVLGATFIGAIINILGNLYFIEQYSYNGAAITTLLSEIIVFSFEFVFALKLVKIRNVKSNLLKILSGIVCMLGVYRGLVEIELGNLEHIIVSVLACGIAYVGSMILLKQDMIFFYTKVICTKLKMIHDKKIYK